MAGYWQMAQAARSEDLAARVTVACLLAAQDVIQEDPATANHEIRRRLANQMLSDPDLRTRQFKWLCASNPAIAETVTVNDVGTVTVGAPDSDLQFVVNSNWDFVAGWSPF